MIENIGPKWPVILIALTGEQKRGNEAEIWSLGVLRDGPIVVKCPFGKSKLFCKMKHSCSI